jgi:hypothetical protein
MPGWQSTFPLRRPGTAITLTDIERVVLAVVHESDGRWDTRGLDFEYYRRSQQPLEPSILHVLRHLESRGLVSEMAIEGGTGPGWRLTTEGAHAIEDRSAR